MTLWKRLHPPFAFRKTHLLNCGPSGLDVLVMNRQKYWMDDSVKLFYFISLCFIGTNNQLVASIFYLKIAWQRLLYLPFNMPIFLSLFKVLRYNSLDFLYYSLYVSCFVNKHLICERRTTIVYCLTITTAVLQCPHKIKIKNVKKRISSVAAGKVL